MEVRRLAARYLPEPVQVPIQPTQVAVPATDQVYLTVPAVRKLQALTQVWEPEPLEAVRIFVRTQVGATDLAAQLQVRGYAAEALHGDLRRAMREHAMRRLRTRALAFLIATDVTARVRSISRRVRLSSRLPLRGFFAMVIECRTCWLRLTASGSVSARTSR